MEDTFTSDEVKDMVSGVSVVCVRVSVIVCAYRTVCGGKGGDGDGTNSRKPHPLSPVGPAAAAGGKVASHHDN